MQSQRILEALVFIGLGSLGGCAAPDSAGPRRVIASDKETTASDLGSLRGRGEAHLHRDEYRYAIGMPCGGVAAGQVYLLGDGTLGEWHINGELNATGYGSESYRTRRPARQLEQGFRLVVDDGSGTPFAAVLADRDFGGDFDAIEFIGTYPTAEVRYRSTDEHRVPPVEVTLTAGSPFIPLNARDSALPCTVMRFSLRSRADHPLTGSLTGWLENAVERVRPGRLFVERRNQPVQEAGMSSIVMDAVATTMDEATDRPDRVLFDFEGDDFRGWTVEGHAFGTAPGRGTLPNQSAVEGYTGRGFVSSYHGGDGATGQMISAPFKVDRRFLVFRIGGGSDMRQTSVQLFITGRSVGQACGDNSERLDLFAWDLSPYQGEDAQLEIMDRGSGAWAHINVDDVMLSDRLPRELCEPRPDALTNGTMALTFLGDAAPTLEAPMQLSSADGVTRGPVAMLEAPFTLAPGETKELQFVISWHFPNLHTGHGQMYTNWFESALDVARYVSANEARLRTDTELFRTTYFDDATLPWWLAQRLIAPVANLATGTAQWWKNGRFWGWGGVGCCEGTCTHVWNYSHAEARLFPELARSTRVMQDLGTAFEPESGRVAFRGEVGRGSPFAADGQAGTVLKCYREHLTSTDDAFLRANWPRIKRAMECLIASDVELSRDNKPDGIILTAQPNTFDIEFFGANTFVGALYLAALEAAAVMAGHMDDAEFAAQCRAIATSGRAWTERNLFTGAYFVQRNLVRREAPFQYDVGCLSDQLFGQNWARALALPTVYDETMVRTALQSIYRYNWSPVVGVYNARFPPERVFARDREGGLFVCTWPNGGRPKEPVRYRDEVWTGIEYQVAAGMIWEGLVDEALTIVKAVDQRYDGALHNPWNEVECGDHYARAMASWGVLLALGGFEYDGPAGLIGMAPRLTAEQFASFFSGAEGWGRLEQTRAARVQTNTVDVRWGRVRLSAFRTELPPEVDAAGAVSCEIRAGDEVMNVTIERHGRAVTARWATPVVLEAGTALHARWSW
ncbi:MAG: GH116 family glycosyl hydrolase [Phycisphaerae bacterium]|nr:GH116 family glycosyl hydrolase [Phycisphaerae bacterium]